MPHTVKPLSVVTFSVPVSSSAASVRISVFELTNIQNSIVPFKPTFAQTVDAIAFNTLCFTNSDCKNNPDTQPTNFFINIHLRNNDERWEMRGERWEMNDERWTMRDERWIIQYFTYIHPKSFFLGENIILIIKILQSICTFYEYFFGAMFYKFYFLFLDIEQFVSYVYGCVAQFFTGLIQKKHLIDLQPINKPTNFVGFQQPVK